MAITQKEVSKRNYEKRKHDGKCPSCGKDKDRDGFYCNSCLEKQRVYRRESREFFEKNHLCTACGKNAVYGSDKTCFECRAKNNKRRKTPTEEQKKKWGQNFRKQQKSLYQQRVEQGICTRCGKLKAISGKRKCGVCLEKDAEIHRRKYLEKPDTRKYREENNLCFFCGKPIDRSSGKTCSDCWEKFHDNGKRNASNNKYWREDNRIIFSGF